MRNHSQMGGLLSLVEYIKDNYENEPVTMIEIGSYAGESTIEFSKLFKKVFAIDPYEDIYHKNQILYNYMNMIDVGKIFKENIKNHNNIVHIHKRSDDAILELRNEHVDFIYIDGIHTYEQVKKDILNYKKLIKTGGFLGGHDYCSNYKGVIEAVNENLGIPDKIFSDTSWIKKIL